MLKLVLESSVPFEKELWTVFKKYDDDGKLKISNIRSAFNDLNLFPSYSQVQEMVHCAVEYGSPCMADHVTFGEFCVLVDELRHHYETCFTQPLPQSVLPSKVQAHGTEGRRKRKDSSSNFQVFLGGSCGSPKGPSLWRQQEAIPYLKQHNITFYNPQVNTWRPELIELEDRAKQVADLLLFVIENCTRAVVSLCEIAYLVGCQRQIVVMFKDLKGDVFSVCDETISEREKEDLRRGRQVLIDIIERNGIPVFDNMNKALDCLSLNIHQGVRIQDLTLSHGAQPVKHGHMLVGEALLKLRETFNSITCDSEGRITKDELRLGYRCFTGRELSASNLHQRRPDKLSFSFEEFCCIVTECKRQRPSVVSSLCTALFNPFRWIAEKFGSQKVTHADCVDVHDIYLGGSCGDTNWREDIALPLIKRHGVSFHNPHVTEWYNSLIPMQVAEREKCRLMLYVITNTTRAVAAMVEAAYYIGLGCRVVLCLQKLQPNIPISSEEVTHCALQDYNRGRAYLSDMASREGVPEFEDVAEAVECAINQINEMHSLQGT
ncbi:uncharacterized protein LOC112574880 isoform X2 [Pomacea canaliculata]|uniref:uncharacterized protein LOC112574880 isoform X2 n=1 Tax=Pomacea canaliculata TaxID=400727 RepID=UPI000D73E835|nr:uncharacterized protein LOC112574880 isoform X2 [Pomacea canaliculata]